LGDLSVYPLLRQIFGYSLEWPEAMRRTFGAVDLTNVVTYGKAAQKVCDALLKAARPLIIEAMGDDAPADAKDWRPKLG
jgi:hypothetical protein